MSLAQTVTSARYQPSDLRQIGPVMRMIEVHNVAKIYAQPKDVSVTISPNAGGRPEDGIEMRMTNGAKAQVARISVTQNRLRCSFCSTSTRLVSWCSHIQWLAANYEDRLLLGTTEMFVDLPMIPTDGVYVRFLIDRPGDGQFDHVKVHTPALDGSDNHRDWTIGIARRGLYGLRDVRNWYYDWITATLDDRRFFHEQHIPAGPVGIDPADRGGEVSISPLAARIYQGTYGKMLGDIEAELLHQANAPQLP